MNTQTRDMLREVARFVGGPVWRRLRPRIEAIAARQAEQATRQLAEELRRLREDLERGLSSLHASLDDLRRRTDDLDGRSGWTENEVRRMGPHLAAVDERVAMLERPAARSSGDTAEQTESRSVLEEVRAEHARIRARLTAIARFEERLARLEEAAARETAAQRG
ncbi:MAG TPA: hypothetical protein VIL00_06725 [Pseudonocardiaceae bacterium]